ncbi:MAG: NUDIX hydrolase [Anaerolineales bacterium]|jgi:8-oxo-dGTP pyrophosphatase MutT (NUDIX family)
MPPQPWKTLSTRLVYQNPWTSVHEDIAEMPNGRTTVYGVVETGQCVGVLPYLDDDRVILVRQFRYVFGENQRWEMPTGGVRPGEGLLEAARRELREEIGYDAGELQPISTYYPSKSVMHETAHLYIGRDLVRAVEIPDDTEFFEVASFPFEQVLGMVLANEIRDSMTVIAVLHAAYMRGEASKHG